MSTPAKASQLRGVGELFQRWGAAHRRQFFKEMLTRVSPESELMAAFEGGFSIGGKSGGPMDQIVCFSV
jgi:hypothetical protein